MKIKGKKQIDALKHLEQKEQAKLIEDKSNNQSKAKIILNDIIKKLKKNNERIT